MQEELTQEIENEFESEEKQGAEWEGLQKKLLEPFDIHLVEFRPGNVVGEDRCAPLAYVPWMEYVKRLDEICPGHWYVCELKISEGTHRVRISLLIEFRSAWNYYRFPGVGDADATKDNGTSSAFDQALKRACALAGLGRYLYDGQLGLVPYSNKRIQEHNLSLAIKLYEQLGFYVSSDVYKEVDQLPKFERKTSNFSGSNDTNDLKALLEKKLGQLKDFNKVPDSILKNLNLEQATAMQKRFMAKNESKEEILKDYQPVVQSSYRRPWQN